MPYPNDACGKTENCIDLKGSHALVGRGGGCTFGMKGYFLFKYCDVCNCIMYLTLVSTAEAKAHAVDLCGAASLIVVDTVSHCHNLIISSLFCFDELLILLYDK